MTDSESDTSNNVFTFQNVNTTVSAKGPNTNITNLSFRNQMTSTMYMPRNFERARYAESAYDQRSMYYRRETSPMSMHSACDIRPRNFQQLNIGRGSQQSAFNGRSGSPLSVRSIDSSASLSAADIAFAFKNVKFNKYDFKVIREAYHKLMKQRVRKRIEKRRNMRLFLKGSKKQSGEDSGEQGSNSSLSDDDCRSIKTSYKENMSSNRSAKNDLSEFRKTFRDSNLQDCSQNFRHNTFKNMFSVASGNVNNMQNINNTIASKNSNPIPTQKDRFRNGFLLPSQRFNRSVASSTIPENRLHKNKDSNGITNVNCHSKNQHNLTNNHCSSGSEDEVIFAETTVRENSTYNIASQLKRKVDSEDDLNFPDIKKSKISSPTKFSQQNKAAPLKLFNPSKKNIEKSINFEFAKPALPVRKSKSKVQEKLIAKSSQPLTNFLEPVLNKVQQVQDEIQDNKEHPINSIQKSNVDQTQLDQSETQNDVSMRPSFIKRKLFTQRLDVAEKANLSSDSTNSPQSLVHPLQKEKNKARKLVTNQSCLNREVQDDSNLLDLIHKIVPPDRMNITSQTPMNQTKIDVNNKNITDNEDKWDVTSVISMCNEDDASDTYTDEEIFKGDNSKKGMKANKNCKKKKTEKVSNNEIIPPECKVIVEKLQNNNTIQKMLVNHNINLTHNNVIKDNVQSSTKSFWDTDFESDVECQTVLSRNHVIGNPNKGTATNQTATQDFKTPGSYTKSLLSKNVQHVPEVSKQLNNSMLNNTLMNNTVDSMRKFNTSTLSIRTHRTYKKKNSCNETCTTETKSISGNQIKIPPYEKMDNPNNLNKKSDEKKNSKCDTQSKNYIEKPKSKLSPQNNKVVNKTRSKSETKNTNNKEKKVNKPVLSPKNTKSKTKSNPETPSEAVNKSEPKFKNEKQHKNTGVKNKKHKQNESIKDIHIPKSNTQCESKKSYKDNSPKDKSRTTKNKTLGSHPSKLNVNNTIEAIKMSPVRRDRPLRSCRTPSQNRSTELSRSSQLNNTSDTNRSLRSRVINLSSSIENITIKIKPRNKTIINNKNTSVINTRMSDVSFSLDKQTPTPKKVLARSKADFFKGKRKT